MSYIVDIEKKCGCVKKSGIEFPKSFDSLEEAKKTAEELANEFSETFCQKHHFKVEENGDNFTIKLGMN